MRSLDYLVEVYSSITRVEDGMHAVSVYYTRRGEQEKMFLVIEDDGLIAVSNNKVAVTLQGFALTVPPPPYLLRYDDVNSWALTGLRSLIEQAQLILSPTIQ